MKRVRKGDTLVEVMFAVAIFGLVAIGAIALMNHGLSVSQNTLETTMARQEIDAQIESLRFIHDAYISESKQDDSTYRGLWNTLTQYAYKADSGISGILLEDADFYNRVVENDKSCDEIFSNGFPSKSFVVNPRKLDSSVADEDSIVYYDDTVAEIREAAVYPRLIYTGSDNSDLSDASATNTGVTFHNNSTLEAAEGIWVTAVASDSEVKNEPDFYDFYVHTCWNKAGGHGSTTINSILRLYNPDQIVYDTRTKVNGYALIFNANGGVTVPEAQTYNDITYPRHTFTITSEVPTWDSVHRFIGWSRDENAAHGSYFPGDDLTVYQYKTKLYAIWEQAWTYRITYNPNTGSLPSGFSSSYSYGPSFDDTHVFTIPTAIPTKTGYTFLGWAESATGPVKYSPGDSVTLQNPNLTKALYAKWKIISSPCTKQYRLQNANGSYPSTYTIDSTETLDYGQTCNYSKSVDYYVTKSTSQVMGVNPITLSLDLPRTTYTLTVNRNTTHISAITGTGVYRWGQSVPITATAHTGHSFTEWTQSGTAGTFASSTSASTTFTMGKGNATIYANGKINKYTVDVNPVINGTTYGSGLSGYTFDVYVNGSLVSSNVTDYYQELEYGTTVRVVAKGKTGYTLTNGDVTKTIGTSNISFNPTWTVNQYTCTKRYRLQNADGTYPTNYTQDGTQAVNFGDTCSYSKSVSYYGTKSTSGTMTTSGLTLSLDLPRNTYTLTVTRDSAHISAASGSGTYRWGQSVAISATAATGHSFTSWTQTGTSGTFANANAASTTFTMGKGNTTVTAGGKINAYTCTKRYRLQNADGSYPSSYTADGTQSVNYGATCSYSKSVTDYQTKSTSGTMGTSGLTLSLDLPRNTYTCSKRYRLQNADGSYGGWNNDGSAAVRWGASCSYSKSVTDYQTKSTSVTMPKSNTTVEVSLPRNTYTLTVNRDTNHISSVSGGGTYRWGQSVTLGATALAGHSFTGWAKESGEGTLSGNTFTMGKGAASVKANGKINAYTCVKRYRLQNADGSYPNAYTSDGTTSINYGATCSYSKSVTNYQSKSTSGVMGTSGITLSLDLPRNTYTLTKRYALQNANGSYPGYTNDGNVTLRWGASYTYSKSASGYQTRSVTVTMQTANRTADVQLPRNTYTLTVNRDTSHIASVSGGGTYRWGQSVSLGATAYSGHQFTGWTHQSGAGSLSGNTFTMGQGNATVYANGKTSTYYFPSFTNSMCSSIAGSGGKVIYDSRDGQPYWVYWRNGRCESNAWNYRGGSYYAEDGYNETWYLYNQLDAACPSNWDWIISSYSVIGGRYAYKIYCYRM